MLNNFDNSWRFICTIHRRNIDLNVILQEYIINFDPCETVIQNIPNGRISGFEQKMKRNPEIL